MTWLKLGEEFTRETRGLSDAAFRTHIEGLAWVVDQETGGALAERDVIRFAETDNPSAAVAELVDAGYWQRTKDGYTIEHHMCEQPTPEYLRDKRRLNAERQARHREKKALLAQGLTEGEAEIELVHRGRAPANGSSKRTPPNPSGRPLVTRYATRDPERSGTERSGTERSGTERSGSSYTGGSHSENQRVESWPTVQPGAGHFPENDDDAGWQGHPLDPSRY